jgi:hypothetical protein
LGRDDAIRDFQPAAVRTAAPFLSLVVDLKRNTSVPEVEQYSDRRLGADIFREFLNLFLK